jgi:Ca2+-binding RTX toxin-like protein
LQLTVDKPLTTGSFNLTATATSAEISNAATASVSASTAVVMPLTSANEVPTIGNSDVILSNESGFVGTVTQTIDTQFGDGANTFSWVSVADSLPDIYANGELVSYTLTVRPDGLTGTVTGSTSVGPIFALVIQLNPGADADVTYTQYASLLGSEVVGTGDNMVTGGGNGSDLLLTFDAGGTTFDALITGVNYLDGTTTTINTNNKYIGAANNLMNPGERITMDFASGMTGNAVASMQISFFNFDSESRIAPDELTVTGTTVDGSTFSYYVTNANLDADGKYTITAPGGELIETLVFESGSQSSFKLGIESVSAVKYDVNFDLALDYQLTDVDGDSATGTISITLDGDNAIIGTAGDDVLLGGSSNDVISGGDGNDLISGGAGDDLLGGGLGSDVFAWSLADKGTAGSPAVDTITDFNTAARAAGGDVLDLRDLLSGENSGNLTDYLHFEKVGSDTVVHIKSAGAAGAEDQTVLLQGVDLYAAAGIGIGSPDQQIIDDLVAKGKLITD